MSCSNCKILCERINIFYPYELYDIIEGLKKFCDAGVIILIDGTCGLDEIKSELKWPNDTIEFKFKCSKCNQKFILYCDCYHGRGSYYPE